MGCGCNKKKPKGGGKSFTKAVVEIHNPEKITLLRKVVIPASLGDETTIPPAVGAYRNVVLCYEASKKVYLYSSDGIPTFISTDFDAIEYELERLGVAIDEETEAREQADSELEDSISDLSDALSAEVSARVAGDAELEDTVSTHTSQISDLSTGLGNEIDNRQSADTNLQSQIDAISAASDVKDIVGTYAELEAYDTTHLGDNDIIKVLQDETQDDATTYYRWDTSTQEFTLIGEEGPYYTKSQTDDLLTNKQNVLTAGDNITITGDTISATDTTYSAGNGLSLNGTTFSADTTVLQPKLTAGDNISITNNTISATDTTYTAGSGLDLAGTEFSIDNTVALKTDLPTVNNAVFTVQKNGVDVASFTANSAVDATANITVPTDTAQLTNTAGYQTSSDVASAISGKQDTLTPGNNIQINGTTISATNTTYSAGSGLDLTGTVFSADTDVLQTKLTAGDNISISNGVISSTGPTYSAGTGLELTNNVFAIDDSVVALKSDIPVISSATLIIQRNGTDVATFTTDAANPVTANILVPTNNAQLTNGAGYQTASDVQSLISGKQDTLTPGTNIQINGNTISATDTKYSAGTGLNLTGTVFSADTTVLATQSDLSGKQDTLTPGSNITITNNTISATDTTYSDFNGADTSTNGTAGLVPAPAAGDNTKFLSGDGTWKTVPLYDLPIASASTLGGIKVGSGLSIDSTTGVLSATTTPITLYDSTGQNTDGAMTQKAVTDALSLVDSVYSDKTTSQEDTGGAVYIGNLNSNQQEIKDPTVTDYHYKYFWALPSQNLAPYNNSVNILGRTGGPDSIALGQAIANTQYAIAIGSIAQVYGVANRGVAIGTNAIATKANSVALGAYAKTDRVGEVNVGTGTSGYGYNNTNYRVIGGVHDPVNAQDAATKNYVDTHIPTVPTNVSAFTNDAGYITNTVNDLTNYTLTSALATVATSGSYNDLSDKPSIPAAQVNSDWNASSGVAQILNKPILATVATSGSYNNLSDKPTIPSSTSDLTNDSGFITNTVNNLTNYPLSSSLATVATTGSYNDLSDKPTIPTVPTNVSAFTNDANYQNSSQVQSAIATAVGDITSFDYQVVQTLPATGVKGTIYLVPNSGTSPNIYDEYIYVNNSFEKIGTTEIDLSDYVTNSELTTELSNYTPTSSLATVATSGSYNDLANKPTIPAAQVSSDWNATSGVAQILNKPTKLSQFTNDSGFITSYTETDPIFSASPAAGITSSDIISWDNKSDFSGDYNDLTNKPTIPAAQVNSDWNSNSGVSQILNKPTLANVATSGSYNDLSNKPTIPAAQVNSDWDATGGVAEILNKPTIPTKTSDLTNDSGFVTSSDTIAKANQLTTARTIAISGGATGTATSFNGTSNISIPVTDVKSAYVTWGGKDIIQGVSPDDAGCIDEFGHNKLAFLPAECIEVEYSTDGGTTWTDYGLTDSQKVAMVTTVGPAIKVGKNTAATASNIANLRGRIRIACGTLAKSLKIYTSLKKILINFSTNGATGTKVKMRYRTIANYLSDTDTWVDLGTHDIGGWSGWNSYPYSGSFGGNMNSQTGQPGQIELEYWGTGYNSRYDSRCAVIDIRFIGVTNWSTPSELARAGHLYTMDDSQNATFPADVKVTGSLQHGNYTYTLPSKTGTVAMTSDIPTVNNATLTITQNGTSAGTFTANASSNKTIALTDTTYSDFTGADASTAGTAGLVPAPAAGDNTKYLAGDGTWKTASQYALPIASANELGGIKVGSRLTINSSTGVLSADSQTDNNFTTTLKDKLDGIASGAEVNVQADWTEASSSSDAYIKNKPSLATVATSGSYNDLSNKPTIPTVPTNVSAFTNDSGYQNSTQVQSAIDSAISGITGFEYQVVQALPATGEKGVIYLVPNSGSTPNIYDEYIWVQSGQSGSFEKIGTTETDLSGYVTDEELQTTLADYTPTSNLAAVATSGSYNDLSNKPTIPAAQVNSDWNASSGVAQILNKPTLATVATSGSYNDLSNKPTIPTVNNATLTIQKNGTTVKTFTANASSNVTANITVPTATSDLTNDSGFITGVAWGDVTGKPTFATVATTGSYDDLEDKPTIPAAQVNADWNASSGVAQILNKPTIPTVPAAGTTATAVSTTASGGSASTWSKSDHVHSISSSTITSALGYTPYNSTNPNGYTSNTGTITGVSANGTSVATSGVANIPAATTGRYGVTQLSSATNSTSTSLAATPSAVKAAYDLANGKQDKLTAGTGIDITGNVISATAVANTFASYQNGTLYITNAAQNADTENF